MKQNISFSNFTKHHSLQKHSKFVFSWNLVQYIGQAIWQSLFTCIDFIRLHWTQKCKKKKSLSSLSLSLSLKSKHQELVSICPTYNKTARTRWSSKAWIHLSTPLDNWLMTLLVSHLIDNGDFPLIYYKSIPAIPPPCWLKPCCMSTEAQVAWVTHGKVDVNFTYIALSIKTTLSYILSPNKGSHRMH